MTPSRKKLITGSVLLLGVGVVVVAGITLYPSLRERYWMWKLESEVEEERLTAPGSMFPENESPHLSKSTFGSKLRRDTVHHGANRSRRL